MKHGESTRDKPSNVYHDDRYTVRVYTDESTDPHVYTNAKHIWHKQNGTVMVILHYYDDGTFRYVHWPIARVVWYQVTPARFDNLEA